MSVLNFDLTVSEFLLIAFGMMVIFIIIVMKFIIHAQYPHKIQENIIPNKISDYSPERTETNGAFSMQIVDVFRITGRGTIITGKVESGAIRVGDYITISSNNKVLKAEVIGIEMLRKSVNEAQEGDNIGLLLGGINKTKLQRGQIITK